MAFLLAQIPPERAFSLRQAVLRPWLSIEELAASDVPAPTFAALAEDGNVLCCATLLCDEAPAAVPASARGRLAGYRLRNMATAPEHRGEGLGRALLGAVLDFVADNGGGLLWCHARIPAVGFYEKLGLERAGEEFTVERIGPHVVMWRIVAPGSH